MTPKTKAEKLIEAHMAYSELGFTNDLNPITIVKTAKHCALITVNAILDEWNKEDGRTAKQKYWREVMQVFNGLFFDLSNDNFFKKIPEYGIALLPLNGHPIPVPGYGSNTGNYTTNLFLTLQRANGIMSKYNITNCQTITGDD